MKKRLVALGLALVLSVVGTACGEDDEEEEEDLTSRSAAIEAVA